MPRLMQLSLQAQQPALSPLQLLLQRLVVALGGLQLGLQGGTECVLYTKAEYVYEYVCEYVCEYSYMRT